MILPWRGVFPTIPESVFVAPSADIIGDVVIGEESSIWFQTVIRGDVNSIRIGARTNIQDQSCLHVTRRRHPLVIGNDVTVGHRVTLHGCTLGDRILVGMATTILDGAQIGNDVLIGAGSLVTQGAQIPPEVLAMGAPARVIRALTKEELDFLKTSALNYVGDRAEYLNALRASSRH